MHYLYMVKVENRAVASGTFDKYIHKTKNIIYNIYIFEHDYYYFHKKNLLSIR